MLIWIGIETPSMASKIEDIRNIHVIDRLVSECDIIYHLAAAVGVQHQPWLGEQSGLKAQSGSSQSMRPSPSSS